MADKKEPITETDEQAQGGIVIDDVEESKIEELNSGAGRVKIAPGKLIALLLVAVLILGGGLTGGLSYIMHKFGLGHKKAEATKTTRTYSAAPPGIGKLLPPAPMPKTEEKVEPTPIVIRPGAENTNTATETKTDETITKRLGSGLKSYSSSDTTPKSANASNTEGSVDTQSRVKLMKNIDYTLIKGTNIPCTMETNVISEQSGYTSCVISQDVYSGNARVLLIEKGTRVTGEYINEDVKNGDKRLSIIWDRLITPYDIAVQIKSPSSDRLGASGVTGKVDNRWGTRIGSALLVSLISDALEIAGKNSDKAQVIVDSKTSDTSQDIAKQILKKNIDLNPIIYIREGEMINIYVADDIDLSSVYQARSTMISAATRIQKRK